MKIPKDLILQFLQRQDTSGDPARARDAERDLPQQVDTDQHGGLLKQYGIDVQQLVSALTSGRGGAGGAIGKAISGFLGNKR